MIYGLHDWRHLTPTSKVRGISLLQLPHIGTINHPEAFPTHNFQILRVKTTPNYPTISYRGGIYFQNWGYNKVQGKRPSGDIWPWIEMMKLAPSRHQTLKRGGLWKGQFGGLVVTVPLLTICFIASFYIQLSKFLHRFQRKGNVPWNFFSHRRGEGGFVGNKQEDPC